MKFDKIPTYLQQYIVDQQYERYTIVDHKVWAFIMDISIPFFQKYAHSSYFEGLNKTGITFKKIPSIKNMNEKMSEIGWGAVPVRGFIPPWAFMEFQALGILPIACDMRTSEHLTYTPAPDIVHESAGHSPIIINEEYAYYLKEYGRIASNAIFSKEDQAIYYAIRKLSDLKENKFATKEQIEKAEKELKTAKQNETKPSEATLLSRLHWWTVEYGLIGSIDDPKIYGAGLLSSVGESQNCLKKKVKKIPLTIDCINYSYDITEQQPQLFVAENFLSLTNILHEFEKGMEYKKVNIHKDRKNIIEKNNESKMFELNELVENYSKDTNLINLYEKFNNNDIESKKLIEILDASYPNEWLLRFEIFKKHFKSKESWILSVKNFLINFNKHTDLNRAIQRGLDIIEIPQ